ncbi:nucleotidyltransferase [Legionella sainthelensi]|uniref:Nucleotidyltransferase n=1 Tax=Legionella sainthelensi TaxID=28087 RepID=A0A2H5FGE4_9GAMM|nr:nucleotidyltransferase [Legionella sainthelensi]AUH70624.1 nucleotidyltransferase [Legionella sainthelensi]
MSYTVPYSFDIFYQNINLSGNHRESANRRKDHIVGLLKKSLEVLDAFSSGSIPRYTALKEHADLDIIVVLHYSKYIKDKKPSEVLQEVRDTLGVYKTNVRKNGQAVTLYYETWPNVDIVPCCRNVDDKGNVTSYSIPDMNTETWIKSRPKSHASNINLRSSHCGENFRKLITMIKHWNKTHGSYLQSYHIEALCLETFYVPMKDLSWEIFTFFDTASKLIDRYLWYEGDVVDNYLNYETRQEVKRRLESARDKASTAWWWTYGNKNNNEEAIKIWRQIFGDKFPRYG